MRLASADRRSFPKWLWGVIGVLAWVFLASVFTASPASADENPDARGVASADSSAHANKSANANANANKNAEQPRANKANPNANKNADKPAKTQTLPAPAPAPVVNPVKKTDTQPAPATTGRKPSSDGKVSSTTGSSGGTSATSNSDDEKALKTAPRSANPWAGVPGASSSASTGNRHDASDSNATRSGHGKHHAFRQDHRGNAYGHAKGKSHAHADSAGDKAAPPRSTRPAAPAWRTVAPAPAQSFVATATPTADTPSNHGPTPEPPFSDDFTITDPWAAPATSGAGAASASVLQMAGEDITGDPPLASMLLGIRTPTDDRVPPGPTSSTDCSPD